MHVAKIAPCGSISPATNSPLPPVQCKEFSSEPEQSVRQRMHMSGKRVFRSSGTSREDLSTATPGVVVIRSVAALTLSSRDRESKSSPFSKRSTAPSSSSRTNGLARQHLPRSFFALDTPSAITLAQMRVQENSIPGEVRLDGDLPETERHISGADILLAGTALRPLFAKPASLRRLVLG